MTDKESAIYSTGYWNGIASKKLRELSDEEIIYIAEVTDWSEFEFTYDPAINFARAIEAYLKSKI